MTYLKKLLKNIVGWLVVPDQTNDLERSNVTRTLFIYSGESSLLVLVPIFITFIHGLMINIYFLVPTLKRVPLLPEISKKKPKLCCNIIFVLRGNIRTLFLKKPVDKNLTLPVAFIGFDFAVGGGRVIKQEI